MEKMLEQHPDLEHIFSDPKADLMELGMTYLSHSDPQVRAATISYVKKINTIGITNALADLLADTSSVVRSAAAQAIWERASDTSPEVNSVAFTLRILRDEIRQTGFVSHMSPEQAMQALELLRSAQPARADDFNKWLMYAWCDSDEELAEHGYKLLSIFSKYGKFLGNATKESLKVGNKIGNQNARQSVLEAIELALGRMKRLTLESCWVDCD